MKERKIEVAMVTNHFDITGIGTVIMNYCKELDKRKYNLTILAGQPIAHKYEQECSEYGIKLVALPSRHDNPVNHYFALWKALKAGKYDIIHDHGNSSMMAIELTIAKWAGIKIRIAHSHNSTCPNMKVHRLLNPYFKKIYTKAFACGKLAGDWLFGEKQFEVLPNGFHTDYFAFDSQSRASIRKELNIENQFVIGHIGRINRQKNQEFLLKVFEKIAPKRRDAVLLIVGAGPDNEKIKEQIAEHPYKNQIIMYGETNNPAAFYSAMDIFAFPSRFEGLPVVLLEAQISGLPCVVSDRVTREVDLGNISWLSIDSEPEIWASKILDVNQQSIQGRIRFREEHLCQISMYDIEQSAKQLDRLYTELVSIKKYERK